MANGSESSPTIWSTLQDWLYQILQLIDLRLALAIGLLAFLVAVGFDSAGNQAEAADLVDRTHVVPTVSAVNSAPTKAHQASQLGTKAAVSQVVDPQLATARRLRHGTLTSAVMTSNRLTQAHFFTDLPSRP